MATPILSIVGKSGSGKTTILEKIIGELKNRGYRVAAIKHHAHPGFEIDQPGKDTWRFTQAGSDCVVLASPDKVAIIQNTMREQTLDEIASRITDADIILTEGFKRSGKPAIEIVRRDRGTDLLCSPPQLTAVVSDIPLKVDVPFFDLEDLSGIVEFIETSFIRI